MRSDGSSLHQSDNYKHYSRHETKPDGSSYNVLIHKTSRVSARCWFHPTAGTHELIESPTEIVETKRDLNGEVVSRSNNCKKMSRAISCTANEVITIAPPPPGSA
jgi:hypothetical protein